MKTTEEIAESILKALDKWKRPNDKIIVGLEGYTATGKTTLADHIAKVRSDVVVVHLDNFLQPKEWRRKNPHLSGRPNVGWHNIPAFRFDKADRILQQYRKSNTTIKIKTYSSESGVWDKQREYDLRKPILLLECATLLQAPIDDYLDYLVFLEGHFPKADKRRYARKNKVLKTSRRTQPIPGDDGIARTELEFWERVNAYRDLYEEYLRVGQPEKKADLVIHIDD